MKIREANPDDASAIAEVVYEIQEIRAAVVRGVAETTATIRANLLRAAGGQASSAFVVEASGGEILAYCAVHWVPFLFLPGGEAYVTELFVKPLATGKQLGSSLLKHVVAEARGRGCARLSLLNGRDSAAYHRRFYEKLGWIERDRMANFVLPL